MQDTTQADELVMTLVELALTRPEDEREAYLRSACGRNSELFEQAWKYVQWEKRMEGFLIDPLYPAECDHPFEPGQLLINRFRVVREVAQGGMGIVCEAIDEKLDRRVAIKCAKSGFRKQLPPEVRNAREISHPNVCKIFEIHTASTRDGEVDFICMEFLDGETLSDRLCRGPLPKEEARTIARQLCAGLAEAHRNNVIHGDLKSKNMILTTGPDGSVRAVITDFGLARRPGASGMPPSSAVLAGTPEYMAPELWKGEKASVASDIYAFGVILWELISGQRPSDLAVTSSTLSWDDRLTWKPPAGHGKWDRIVARCLEADPRRRFGSAAEVAQALGPLRARKWVLGVAAAVLVAIGSGVVATTHSVDDEIVAVLPFTTAETDASAKAVAEGIAEKVAIRLVRFNPKPRRFFRRTFAVIPQHELVAHHVSNAAEARRMLGVNRVIEARIDRSARGERVLVSLIHTGKSSIICGEIVTGGADLTAIEDQIVDVSAKCLDLEPASAHPLASAGRISRVHAANTAYLEGRGYLYGYDIPDGLEHAVRSFAQAVQLDSRFALAYTGLGEAYWRKYNAQRDPVLASRAQQNCDQASYLDDKLAEAHVCLGTLHSGAGEYAEATDEFDQAVRLDPRADKAWIGLARAHSELGKLAEAEKEYAKAVSIRPYWGNYVEVAKFYFDHARYEDAEILFRQAIRQTPDNSELYRGLGGLYIAMGRYEDAITNSKEAVAHRPTFGAYDNLGTAYLSLGRFDEAVANYQRALDLERGDYRAFGNLARAQYWVGRRDEARELYRQAVKLAEQQLNVNPRDVDVHVLLAWYYAMLGQEPEALIHLQSAEHLISGKAEFAFIAGIVHKQFGHRAGTLACLRRARELRYTSAEIRAAPEFKSLHGDPEFEAVVAGTAKSSQ
ncbi:MAG TPA: tetratricopeptide repeat protein [Bryobacteraceae bacterium]|nr:tetratricopeptide repeat protein [Bryobacteraceae bacterium]